MANLKTYLKRILWILCAGLILFPGKVGAQTGSSSYLEANETAECIKNYFARETDKSVPECPDQRGLYILPPYYPPASIFMGFDTANSFFQLAKAVIAIALNRPNPIPINFLMPRSDVEENQKKLKAFTDGLYGRWIRFIFTPADETLWPQDYFEMAMSMDSGKMTLFDLPYKGREGEYIPAALSLACHMNLIAQAPNATMEDSGDYGGNIEAISDHWVAVGDTMREDTRKILAGNLKQKLVDLNVTWLETGHVDEIIMPLGIQNNNGTCSYLVAHASPLEALQKLISDHDFGSRMSISPKNVDKIEDFDEALDRRMNQCVSKIGKMKDLTDTGKLDYSCKELIRANQVYEQIIRENLRKIETALKSEVLCQKTEFISLPVLFVPEKTRKTYGTIDDFAFAFNPNPVNGVLLEKTVILPEQPYGPYQDMIQKKFSERGFESTFVPIGLIYHLNGGIHCGSFVTRKCRPKKVNYSKANL